MRAVCELLAICCGDLLAALYKGVGFFKLGDGVGGIYSVKIVFLTDAIDVVSFSIVGAMVALSYNHNVFGVVLIAFCNGVGGGILRDVLLNEVPWFLHTGLYGTISMGVGLIYFVLDGLGLSGVVSVLILLVLGVAFRMVAYYKSWHLPKVEYKK